MSMIDISFLNNEGQLLAGRLELPLDQPPTQFALFAHCFTCNKNLRAVRNVSRALASRGFGVLRFDFTGLGESEGDFADTNFSGNVRDLIAASDYLASTYQSPSLLIGHSLGGAAVLLAASMLDSVKAVATIGAPSDPQHVQHLLQSDLEEIQVSGVARVDLGGRSFTIKKQFIDDLQEQALPAVMKQLHKALLILHSPQDRTVGIQNAEELYVAAHHPKSFVTLDGADHLLSNAEDSLYVGSLIGSWALRYIEMPKPLVLRSDYQVVARSDMQRKFMTTLQVGTHRMRADEPTRFGGDDFGPTPHGYVAAGLSACTAMTIKMYVEHKGWALDQITVHCNYEKRLPELREGEALDASSVKLDHFDRAIELEGVLTDQQRERILQIADKCPVHKTLNAQVVVRTAMHVLS